MLRCILFTFFVSGAASQPLGSFIPYLRQSYGLGYAFSGLLLSCQSIGNLAAIFLAGILPAYLGRRKSVFITAVWMAAGYLIFFSGLSVPVLLAAACLMTGVARGGNSNFANTLVSTLSGTLATRGYNLTHGCFALGALLTPLLLVACEATWSGIGWRIMAGGLCLLVGAQLAVYGEMPLPQETKRFGLRGTDRSFFRDHKFWLGATMLFFYISAEYAIVGWLVTYFQESGILPLELAQIMNSLLWGVIFAGRMGSAWLSRRLSRNKLLGMDGLGFFLFFLVMFFGRSTVVVTAGIAGMGLFMAGIYPTAFSFGSDSIRGNDLGASALTLAGSVGGVLTPSLIGLVAAHSGIRAGMGVVAILTALLLVSILLSISSDRWHAA